jgi:cleavage and polyadenylation specificity factor subunit 1
LRAGLLLFGKLGSRREQLNALGGLTYLHDSLSGLNFLVDTGAAVSVLPHSASPTTAQGPTLAGADGKGITCWGKVYKSVCFNGKNFTDVPFVLAAVSKPILGADFFSKHHLLVDTATNRVLSAETLLPIGGSIEPGSGSDSGSNKKSRLVAHLSMISPPVRNLLSEFPGVVGDGTTTPKPLHGVEHTIETKGRPLFAKSRRLDPDKLRIAEKEFRALEKMCIVRRSNSGWSSPLHMVPKPDGSFRPCGDYRRLNTVTEDDRYPLPSILDFSSNLAGCTVFSKVDLVKGYHQVPMAEADIPKTAICTPFGLFEYLFMPFGLKNAAQTFQRLMDRLFRHLPFVFVYLDDILIASRNEREHMDHLRQVFAVLQENGLQINPAKCIFAAPSLSFLGHHVDSSGIKPLKRHVQALMDFPPPSDIKQLQRYLGLINFYRRFLPGIAGTLKPLTDLLRGNPKTLEWSDKAEAAFTSGKTALANCTKLVHPTPGSHITRRRRI